MTHKKPIFQTKLVENKKFSLNINAAFSIQINKTTIVFAFSMRVVNCELYIDSLAGKIIYYEEISAALFAMIGGCFCFSCVFFYG